MRSLPRKRGPTRSASCSGPARPAPSPSVRRARSRRAPAICRSVGLFVDPTPDEVRAVLAALPLDVLQFHGDEPPELCRAFGRPYLKAIAVAPGADPARLVEYATRYGDAAGWLFRCAASRGLARRDRQHLRLGPVAARMPAAGRAVGGLSAANVGAAIPRLRPWAVDVSTGVEAMGADGRPIRGIKDPARIAAFVEEVRNADG